MKRIAVVGSGIAGLSAAWHLSDPADPCQVTLFEAEPRAGGHAHTVDVTLPDSHGETLTHGVDTGFLVFNHRTYPRLKALFERLGVDTVPSDMSFSVQADDGALEWSGHDLDSVFAQRRNLLRPRFIGMLAQIVRFNRLATAQAQALGAMPLQADADALQPAEGPTVGEFLDAHGFSQAFRRWYLLPMLGCIWSCPAEQMLRFPLVTMLRFCHNHGLLQVNDRPQWYTVRGGSRNYVQRMLDRIGSVHLSTPVLGIRRNPAGGAVVRTPHGAEHFDRVVLACHTDQALRLLGEDATAAEREVLGAIRYHDNEAVLHTDVRALPRRPKAWAAWNYEQARAEVQERGAVCLHYLINRLQPLPFQAPVIVTLNPIRPLDPSQVLRRMRYAHPVFDEAAIAAQRRLPAIQGLRNTWFCGAWAGYGFHEDGLASALQVVHDLRQRSQQRPHRSEATNLKWAA